MNAAPCVSQHSANRTRVSTIVPIYNGERFLRANLESALAQTYPNLGIDAMSVLAGGLDGNVGERGAQLSGGQSSIGGGCASSQRNAGDPLQLSDSGEAGAA